MISTLKKYSWPDIFFLKVWTLKHLFLSHDPAKWVNEKRFVYIMASFAPKKRKLFILRKNNLYEMLNVSKENELTDKYIQKY